MKYFPTLTVLILIVWGCGKEASGPKLFFGKDMWQLTESGAQYPAWSPDGQSIVFANNQDLWMISPEGGTPERITDMAGTEMTPAWNPNSGKREIVFINNRGASAPSGLYIYRLSCGGRNLTRKMLYLK